MDCSPIFNQSSISSDTDRPQVLFCKLTARQRALYRAVLSSPEIRLILEGKASHFRAITLLRKARTGTPPSWW